MVWAIQPSLGGSLVTCWMQKIQYLITPQTMHWRLVWVDRECFSLHLRDSPWTNMVPCSIWPDWRWKLLLPCMSTWYCEQLEDEGYTINFCYSANLCTSPSIYVNHPALYIWLFPCNVITLTGFYLILGCCFQHISRVVWTDVFVTYKKMWPILKLWMVW